MGKMNELSQAIDNLITCGETLIETGRALRNFYSMPDEEMKTMPAQTAAKTAPVQTAAKASPLQTTAKAEPATPAAGEAPAPKAASTPAPETYTKEEVRGLLAAKANEADGKYKAGVKALVKKYGNGGTLKDVPAESYPDLVKELEGLKDA